MKYSKRKLRGRYQTSLIQYSFINLLKKKCNKYSRQVPTSSSSLPLESIYRLVTKPNESTFRNLQHTALEEISSSAQIACHEP